MRKMILLTMLFVFVICSGCVTMSVSERKMWHEIEGLGLPMKAEYSKSPTLTAFISLVPSVGNFYLAAGSDDGYWSDGSPFGSNHIVAALFSLATFPFQFVWSIPQGILDAGTINKMQTINYYHNNPDGRVMLEQARAAVKEKLMQARAAAKNLKKQPSPPPDKPPGK